MKYDEYNPKSTAVQTSWQDAICLCVTSFRTTSVTRPPNKKSKQLSALILNLAGITSSVKVKHENVWYSFI